MAKTYTFNSGTRMINWLFTAMTRLGLGAAYRHVLTVRGRKSGKLYSTPVDVVESGGDRWLVAAYGVAGWVRNVQASGDVTLSRGSRSESFKAQPVGVSEAVPVLREYLLQVPITRPYFDAAPDSPDDSLAAEVPKHPVFRLVPLE